jgi:hypothetical protein
LIGPDSCKIDRVITTKKISCCVRIFVEVN